jgi:hypothetical protein
MLLQRAASRAYSASAPLRKIIDYSVGPPAGACAAASARLGSKYTAGFSFPAPRWVG